MESLKIELDEKLAKRFRECAMKVFGYGNESISKAAQASIENWVNAIEEIEKQEVEDPVNAMLGLLSDVDIDSVELQHSIKDIWIEMVKNNVSH